MMNKKILVTGSDGQLGNEIRFLSEGKTLDFLFTDINDLNVTNEVEVATFFERHKPDICVNCAAYTAVDLAEDEVEKAYLINEKAVTNLANHCNDHGTTFYHISTDFVFDGAKNTPYVEGDPANPISVYGQSKLKGEQAAFDLNPDTVVLRTSWLYSSFGKNYVQTMLNLSKSRNQLSIIFDQIGTPTYARDLANTILLMIENDYHPDGNRIFHFSNEGVASWYDFSHEIFRIKNISVDLKPIETFEYVTKAKRPAYSVLNKSKIKKELGIAIPHWKESLESCLSRI